MWKWSRRYTPIGVDIGSATLKMAQLTRDGKELVATGCWDLPAPSDDGGDQEARWEAIVEGIRQILRREAFRGHQAIVALSDRQLAVHNVRVPPPVLGGPSLEQLVQQEAQERLSFPVSEAEVRFVSVGDVRQSDRMVKEVILFAARRPELREMVEMLDRAGLQTMAMDAEPCALVRAFAHQFRRSEDRDARSLLVHIGHSRTVAMVAAGEEFLFVKYIPIGGQRMDQAVSRHLGIDPSSAATLRRHHGDRRARSQDPEVARTVWEAVRPAVEQLVSELAMCSRYYAVTFRGRPLSRVVVGGGEATPGLTDVLGQRLKLPAVEADPLQKLTRVPSSMASAAWDVAIGLALRNVPIPAPGSADATSSSGADRLEPMEAAP